MSKIYRILGRKGRTTIPFALRVKYGYTCNDILSFEDKEDGSVIVRKEKICNHCNMAHTDDLKEESLLELLNSLTVSEQAAAYRYLGRKLTSMEGRR